MAGRHADLDRQRLLPGRHRGGDVLQRAGIAQALLHDPEVVFLDEPMSGLDPMGRREVRDLMEQLKKEGRTVFFSTHILSDAEALCDRVAILDEGRLLATLIPGARFVPLGDAARPRCLLRCLFQPCCKISCAGSG